jgi:hypothetical protein
MLGRVVDVLTGPTRSSNEQTGRVTWSERLRILLSSALLAAIPCWGGWTSGRAAGRPHSVRLDALASLFGTGGTETEGEPYLRAVERYGWVISSVEMLLDLLFWLMVLALLAFFVRRYRGGLAPVTQRRDPSKEGDWRRRLPSRDADAMLEASARELAVLLASLVTEPQLAKMIARRAGYPREHLPVFTTAAVFWNQVVEHAACGMTSLAALVGEAQESFPQHPELRRYHERTLAVASVTSDVAHSPSHQPSASSKDGPSHVSAGPGKVYGSAAVAFLLFCAAGLVFRRSPGFYDFDLGVWLALYAVYYSCFYDSYVHSIHIYLMVPRPVTKGPSGGVGSNEAMGREVRDGDREE